VNGKFSPSRRLDSFRFALRGLRFLLRFEHSAGIHLAATLVVVIAGLFLDLSVDQWRWILLAVALVWVGEAFNTAFERLGDAITLEHDPEIGKAKDVAAAAVMICVVAGALLGLSVFIPAIMHRIFN
jgi:diacylglycerol kinase (ATP)